LIAESDLLLADCLDELLLPLVFLLEELAQVVLGGEESLPAPVKSVRVKEGSYVVSTESLRRGGKFAAGYNEVGKFVTVTAKCKDYAWVESLQRGGKFAAKWKAYSEVRTLQLGGKLEERWTVRFVVRRKEKFPKHMVSF
jgi:hypothetical protein